MRKRKEEKKKMVEFLSCKDHEDPKMYMKMSRAELHQHAKKLDEILDVVCKDILPQAISAPIKFSVELDCRNGGEAYITGYSSDSSETFEDDYFAWTTCDAALFNEVDHDLPAYDDIISTALKYDLVYSLFDGVEKTYKVNDIHQEKKSISGLMKTEVYAKDFNWSLKRVDSIEELELELGLAGLAPDKKRRRKRAKADV